MTDQIVPEQLSNTLEVMRTTLNRLKEISDKILSSGIQSLTQEELDFIETYNSRPLVVDIASSTAPFEAHRAIVYNPAVSMEFNILAVGKERNIQNAFTVQDILDGEVNFGGVHYKFKLVGFSETPITVEEQ